MNSQPTRRHFLAATTTLVAGAATTTATTARRSTAATTADDDGPRVVLVTTDGLRWQEVFRGPETALVEKLPKPADNEERLWTDALEGTPEARRAALMPFLWGTVAKQGRLVGNRDAGSEGRVANAFHFSYPGYNELLTGAPDPRVNSNEKRPNPNVTVLEWLHGRPGFNGRVAAYASWDAFHAILNSERAKFPVVACWEPIPGPDLSRTQRTLNALRASTYRLWANCAFDSLTFESALEHLRVRQPRAMFISFGDTDEHAHAGKYGDYLTAARQFDIALGRLWAAIQEIPGYRDNTTLVLSTDHGRGGGPEDWRHHSTKIPGSDTIWAGVLGPKPFPEITGPFTQSQIAATVAAAVGEDFRAAVPTAAPSLIPIVRRPA